MVIQNFIDKFKTTKDRSNDLIGSWQIVQWNPDIVTGEWLNIGVGFKHGDKQSFKWLDDFKKLEIIHNKDTVSHLHAVISLSKKFIQIGTYDFSPQIKVIEIGFMRSESVEQALERSYNRVVTLRGAK